MLKPNYSTFYENKYIKIKEEKKSGWNNEKIVLSSYNKIKKTFQKFNIEKGIILELGCGNGNLILKFANEQFDTYGVDISKTAIIWAKEKSKELKLNTQFFVDNVIDLKFKNNFFNIVIDALCLHCIIGNDREKFLSSVYKVIKKNGLFIILTKCGQPKNINYPFNYKSRCKIENEIATWYWGKPNDLIKELKQAGFKMNNYKIFEYNDGDQFYAELLK